MQNFSNDKESLLGQIKRIGACVFARFSRRRPLHNPEPDISWSRASLDLNNKMEVVIDIEGQEDHENGEEESTKDVDALEGSDRDIELEEKLGMIRADCNEHEKMIIGGVVIPSTNFGRLFDMAIS
jgi:hypothetical protein